MNKTYPTIVGGDPNVETTRQQIITLAQNGAAGIVIGIPFSDPVADSPPMQAAHERALINGCTPDALFTMLQTLHAQITIPLYLMSYMNPIFVYGTDRFMQQCKAVGIQGIIVPDLPFEERAEISAACTAHGIAHITIVAPTSFERIETIAKDAQGFIYCMFPPDAVVELEKAVTQIKSVSSLPCVTLAPHLA